MKTRKSHTLHVYRSRREWRWRVTARNGKKVANGGEGYQRVGALLDTLSNLLAPADLQAQVAAIKESHRLSSAK